MEEVNITWKHYTNKFENSSDMNNLEHTNFLYTQKFFLHFGLTVPST